LDVELNNVFFRKMKTKWASCSSRRNLTVNMLMRCLPEHLLEYVVFHEIAHMIEKRHNDKFWKIVSKEFKNYEELEKGLFIYWFRVVNTI
jgi:predicted metal-dependent hydrolase